MGCTASNFDIDSKLEEEIKKDLTKMNDTKKYEEKNNSNTLQPILNQLKNSICQIKSDNGKKGSGFFCRIQITNKNDLISVLIANNSLLDSKSIIPGKKIKIITNNKKSKVILIDDSRETYKSEKDDITIIELRNNDKLNINSFLEIDDDVYNNNIDEMNLLYLLDCKGKKNIEYSSGIFKSIDKDNYIIEQSCSTDISSSGYPIVNSVNFKVIGIQGMDENQGKNVGIYLKESIEKFKNKINFNKEMIKIKNININNEIKLKTTEMYESSKNINNRYEEKFKPYLVDKKIIKQSIDNSISIKYNIKDSYEILLFGKIFVQNNKNKCKLYIDGLEKELTDYYYNDELKEELEIKLIGINNLIDVSYMFSGCDSLISLSDLSKWKTSNIINMKHMFSGCILLKYFTDISEWDISKVSNMSYMFYNCESLKYISNISKWNTSNVKNINSMFYGCKLITSLPDISNWDTSHINNMGSLFYGCKSLKYLPDLSKWDTSNVIDISYLFYGCSSLFSLSDISQWNISKITNLSHMFSKCEKMIYLPEISEWDTSNVNDFFEYIKTFKI